MTFKMSQDHDWLQDCSEEEIELIKEAKREQDEAKYGKRCVSKTEYIMRRLR
jgi:hypothetical protein